MSTRRTFLQVAAVGGAAATVAMCQPEVLLRALGADDDFMPPLAETINQAAHLLHRLTWGPRPGDYARVNEMGATEFIDRQLHPEDIPDRACERRLWRLEPLFDPGAEMFEHEPKEMYVDLTCAKLLRAVYSRRQLLEVMVDFWTDHFNVLIDQGDCRWVKAADDRDVIRPHALGGFSDLLRAALVSPSTLVYLDGADNNASSPQMPSNENMARELLDVYTLGPEGGHTEQDVHAVSRCLAGWTYENRPFAFRAAHVSFQRSRDDKGEKTVLGHRIGAGGGPKDLDALVDIVAHHPSTARHIAEKLCRRFIADPPPESAVDAVASAFISHRGDIRETLRALFATDEFLSHRGCLFKRPFRYLVSCLRLTRARARCGEPTQRYLEQMGHAPFRCPGYDGYPRGVEAWAAGMPARWRFAFDVAHARVKDARMWGPRVLWRLGSLKAAAAMALGRKPTADELRRLQRSHNPLALLLACPAFQWH